MIRADIPDLQELQALLYRLIAAPNGIAEALANEEEAIDLEQVIVGDERMSAAERAGVYADAYFYRLLDVFKEDFSATLAVIGHNEFHNLITGYLLAHPPAEPSLMYAGQFLASYLLASPLLARWPFIADLARLERALIDSFHAVSETSLDRVALYSIPPEEWPGLSFRLHPSTRLLTLQFRVDETLSAVSQGNKPVTPIAEMVTLIVWRKRGQVCYRAAEGPEAIALKLAELGCEFTVICDALAAEMAADDLPNMINRLLVRWLDDGLLINETGMTGS
jgi:hypothetical protein